MKKFCTLFWGVVWSSICMAQIADYPYAESFESGFGAWVNVNGDDFDWTQLSGGTPSSNTGPSMAEEGSFYVYTEASFGQNNQTANLQASFDFSSIFLPRLEFYYHMHGANMGTLQVDVITPTNTINVFSISGEQQTSTTADWIKATVDLSAFGTQDDIVLRFSGMTGNDFQSDIAIDNIVVLDNCPVNAGTVSVSDEVLCANGSVNLTLLASDPSPTQWQQSTNGGPFIDIPGATNTTYTSNTLTLGNDYAFRAEVTNGCSSISDTAHVRVRNAATNTLPDFATFESALSGWTNVVVGDDNDWTRQTGGTPSQNTGPNGAFENQFYLYVEASNPTFSSTAILEREFNFTNTIAPEMTFRYHMFGADQGNLRVEVNGNVEFSVTGQQQGSSAAAYAQANIDLAAYVGQCNVNIRIIGATGPDFRSDIAIDAVLIEDNCPVVAGNATSTGTAVCGSNGADLSLTGQDGGATIQWQQSLDNITFTDLAGATAPTFTANGLFPGNTYFFRAQVTNGCTTFSDTTSLLITPANGNELPPYTESFETGFGSWVNAGGDDNNWTRQSGGTPSNNTGPSGANDGNFYLFVEASNPNFNSTAFLENSFDFSGAVNPQFNFFYHMFGSDMGTLQVEVFSGGVWNTVFTLNGQQQTSSAAAWQRANVDLTAFAGNCNVPIRFTGLTGNNFRSDMAIDEIVVTDNCPVVAGNAAVNATNLCGVSEVDLSLTGQSGGTTIQWQQSIDNINFIDLAGATAPNFTVSGLAPGSTYFFRAQVQNGCVAISDTVSTIINASAGVNTVPYVESFESGFGTWNNLGGDSNDWLDQSGGTPSDNTGPSGAHDGVDYLYVEASNPNFNSTALLESSFDFSGLTGVTFSFYFHMFGADQGTLALDVNGTEVWSRTGQQQTSSAANWILADVDLSAFAGECNVSIRFRGETGANFRSDIAIDDILVLEPCPLLGGSTTVADPILCGGGSTTVSLSGQSSGVAIQWEQSTDNVTFSPISGANSATLNTGSLAVGNTFYYRAAVTNGCTSFSDTALVFVPAGGGENTLPYTESFETGLGTWSNLTMEDNDWVRENGGTPSNNTGPSGANDGVDYIYIEASNPNFNSVAVLENSFDLIGFSTVEMAFDYHMFGAAQGELQVIVNGVTMFSVAGQQQTSSAAAWITETIDLTPFANSCNVTIQFRGETGNDFTSDIAVDNIRITEPCPLVGGTATISNTALCNAGTVDLALTGQSGGAVVQWQQSTTNNNFIDIAGATTPNFTVNGLTDGNTYFFRARVTNGCNSFSDTVSVSVSGIVGMNTLPYAESFETGLGTWQQNIANDDIDWTRTSGGTPTANTGPSGANDGNFYLFTESSSPNFNSTAILETDFDFSGAVNPVLNFDYHMFGAATGTLSVEANGQTIFTVSGQQQGSNGAAWSTANVDLTDYANQCFVQIRIRGDVGPNETSDIAIDNISITIPSVAWTGAVSTAWDNAANWSPQGVPGSFTNVLIPNVSAASGNFPVVSSDEGAFDLTLAAGSSIDVNAGAQLSISGNWDNQGNAVIGEGEVFMNGSIIQTIAGSTTWGELKIENGNGVRVVSGDQRIIQTLDLDDGPFTTNDAVTLVSDANGTANLFDVNSGTVVGDLIVQRYISVSNNEWREMTAPLRDKIISEWQDDGIVTAGFTGSNFPNFPFISMYTYEENNANGNKNDGWVAATNSTNSLNPDHGYRVFIGSGIYTAQTEGSPFLGTQNYALDYQNDSPIADEKGWNLIGNPYACTVDWDLIPAGNKVNIEDKIWIWSGTAGNYGVYTGVRGSGDPAPGTGTNGVTNNIASGQAFWVHALTSGASLQFNETDKTKTPSTFVKSGINSENYLSIHLSSNVNTFFDEAVLKFNAQATGDYDERYDAYKLWTETPAAPSLTFVTDDNYDVTINTESATASNWEIPMKAWAGIGASGTYTLDFESSVNFDESACIFLEDLLLDSVIDLRDVQQYTFYQSDSDSSNRFLLRVYSIINPEVTNVSCYGMNDAEIQVNVDGFFGENNGYDIDWFDANGQQIGGQSGVGESMTISDLGPGTYEIVATDPGGSCGVVKRSVNITQPEEISVAFELNADSFDLAGEYILEAYNGTLGADFYQWNFGDGVGTSIDESPNYWYDTAGHYVVSLIASDEFSGCTDTLEQTVVVYETVTTSIEDPLATDLPDAISLLNDEQAFALRFEYEQTQAIKIEVFNAAGQQVAFPIEIDRGNAIVPVDIPETSGIYLLHIQVGQDRYVMKLFN